VPPCLQQDGVDIGERAVWILLSVSTLANVHDFLDAIDWGDAPTWLGAGTSAGALVAAVTAAVIARRLFRIESNRDHVAQMERSQHELAINRQQASCVAAWPEYLEDADQDSWWYSIFRNTSELPVFDVSTVYVGFNPSSSVSGTILGGETRSLLPPGEIREWSSFQLVDGDRVPFAEFRIELHFRDASGNYWHRDSSGQLRPVRPASAFFWGPLTEPPTPPDLAQLRSLDSPRLTDADGGQPGPRG
jgi:hypothetical protein